MEMRSECPICQGLFPMNVVEMHAALCGLSPNEGKSFDQWTELFSNDQDICNPATSDPQVQPREKTEAVTGTGGVKEERLKGAEGGQRENEDGEPCPVCQVRFPRKALQDHAELCGESPEMILEVIGNISLKCPYCQDKFKLKDSEFHSCISPSIEQTGENQEDSPANLERTINRYIEMDSVRPSGAKVESSGSPHSSQMARLAIGHGQEEGTSHDDVDHKEPVIQAFLEHLDEIGKGLDNDEIFQKHLENLWLECKGDPVKFFHAFKAQCTTYATNASLNPQCVIPYIVKYVKKKISEKQQLFWFMREAHSYIGGTVVPWVIKVGGWRMLMGWFMMLPIGGVAYLMYSAYQRYQSWGKQPEPEEISHSKPSPQSEESTPPRDVA